MKPTIVLVHGAFAESASWNKVIDSLAGAGHPVIAAPNPLRSPAADAAAVGDLLRTVCAACSTAPDADSPPPGSGAGLQHDGQPPLAGHTPKSCQEKR